MSLLIVTNNVRRVNVQQHHGGNRKNPLEVNLLLLHKSAVVGDPGLGLSSNNETSICTRNRTLRIHNIIDSIKILVAPKPCSKC